VLVERIQYFQMVRRAQGRQIFRKDRLARTRLPEYLMDYVILHELVHTRIKNHGPRFYAELDRLIGDRKEMDKILKAYGVGLL
ncbi:MAG: hypothetical protein DSY89_08795, partial [Deltaproteobacteria bacterium]